MKRYFCLFIVFLVSTTVVFAQQSGRFTIDELRSDGTFLRTTVNALFIGCSMQWYSLEGYYHVIYERFCPYDEKYGEWSNWELTEKAPARSLNMGTYYDNMLREYSLRPRRAMRILLDGEETIWVMSIPNGYTSPILWYEDGNSFFINYGIYKILP